MDRYCVLSRGSGTDPDGVLDRQDDGLVEASVKLKLNGEFLHTVRDGTGPLHALELALREALRPSHPRVDEMELTGYTVHSIDRGGGGGTSGRVRVVLQSWDRSHDRSWGTEAVSHDIVKASWLALVDTLDFKRWLDTNDARPVSSRGASADHRSCSLVGTECTYFPIKVP
jgi:2-isopropylmalate synthase